MGKWYHGDESDDGDYNFTGVVGGTDGAVPDDSDTTSSRADVRPMTGIRHYGKGRINITPKGGRNE